MSMTFDLQYAIVTASAVNNAGTGSSGLLLDTSYDEWRKIIATNLDGAFVCMRQAAKDMVQKGNGGGHKA
jgi:NAD(P)-dependent dehydrogenase (short-subunit alcohol dehydrogenase family)